jgi:hypothetical protein
MCAKRVGTFPGGSQVMFLIGFVIGAMATVMLAVLVDA